MIVTAVCGVLFGRSSDDFHSHATINNTTPLHNHAELQLVFTDNTVLLRLKLVDVPLAVDESPRCPRSRLLREPNAHCTTERDVVLEHYA